jgi:hypothetical protein
MQEDRPRAIIAGYTYTQTAMTNLSERTTSDTKDSPQAS